MKNKLDIQFPFKTASSLFQANNICDAITTCS